MVTNRSYSTWFVINGVKKIHEGDLLIWQKGSTVFGHVGVADEDWPRFSGHTVEANTSSGTKGSQSNGDGIYRRSRTLDPTSYFRIIKVTPIEQ